MRPRWDQVASWTLTAAAVLIAAAVVRREFVPVRAVETTERNTEVLVHDPEWRAMLAFGVHQAGNPAGAVKLVEFADLECPVCEHFQRTTITEILQRYGSDVSLTFIHFPLEYHRFARMAAKAAECAAEQDRFGAFVVAIYLKQDSLGLKAWASYAHQANVPDTVKFMGCLTHSTAFPRIDSGLALARRLKLSGTPTLFANGWRFATPPTSAELSRVIDRLKAGKNPKN